MNNNYFDKSVFPGQAIYSNDNMPSIVNAQPNMNYNTNQSYIENILKMNKGKKATIHMTFNKESKEFSGIIEQSGKDYIIVSDPTSGKWYMLPIKYLDFITFDEQINYINF